jgi:hypothetical protein
MPDENLVGGLHRQIVRVRTEVIPRYREIRTGWPAAFIMEKLVEQGEKALAGGDVVEMVRAYKRLEDCQL